MDQALTFANALPAWTGPDGMPMSWKHFAYGMRFIVRLDARGLLNLAAGTRAGGAVTEDYEDWRADLKEKA